MPSIARGTFDVELTPRDPEAGGAVARFDLSKVFHGDLEGTGVGVMLSGGDPQAGSAGYVAMETFAGTLEGRNGSFVLQQYGTVTDGDRAQHYEVVPGTGDEGLGGITGAVELTIDDDGTHRYQLSYEL